MINDVRLHDYHIIDWSVPYDEKWSDEWSKYPGLQFAWEWEKSIKPYGNQLHALFQQYWHYSLYLSVVYVITLAALTRWMTGRQRAFELRLPMAVWSASLAVFSMVGVARCLPEFIHILVNHGFEASFCNACYYNDFRLTLWYLFFVVSKAAELVDTIFIVLRKQRLIRLHWIHHVLTLCYSWYVFGGVPATARWMVNMNFLIHSLMYTYYALRAVRVRLPRAVNVTITTLQILQMLFGLYINFRVVQFKLSAVPCDISLSSAIAGLALYSLFFILFVNYFVRTYVLRPVSKTIHPFIADFNHNQYSKSATADINNVVKKLQ